MQYSHGQPQTDATVPVYCRTALRGVMIDGVAAPKSTPLWVPATTADAGCDLMLRLPIGNHEWSALKVSNTTAVTPTPWHTMLFLKSGVAVTCVSAAPHRWLLADV